ncbi:coenzyme F420 hydrogenase/dehydrogenase beta subunit domain protein [Caldicellulosiruptor owensensis OL]|uniref:Coenzyme F420 hydrogenase/dehydrogenase beta subunit domain protein n=1 Tax=Caldicellulosiruptor owensensis (strain ATCC 700167 / DSM 13100 / OL) TaxID=632518 RepID=E4Q5S2_CALOW|nr:Coenzyme F420 hydrogenase/dehydrogenase, beta subunit C-terminal domain [Caldicellulosiruptor owensensis]ADQ05481.1 coenzyme F420 hydrogenase/dehydrogenase beta subunit domain protein [Caldicellulosiruptor owensensis OL]
MLEKILDLIGNSNCTGCYACYNICEMKAIEIRKTEDGFYKPVIKKERCIGCGFCITNCPVLNPEYSNNPEPKFYMGWSKNQQIRKASSSGGIFSEIAIAILESRGIVFGAAWDDCLEVKHIKVDSIDNLYLLRGSKYLQSKVGYAYKEIKEILENSQKNVLFVGTPCQVAGLKKIVKSDRLITCDLVCHGIPSYIPFKSFIEALNEKVEKVNFRDKITGWRNFSLTYYEKKRKVSHVHYKDKFFMGYLRNYYLNEACYSCLFSKLPRQGDITLGDFWGIEKKYDKKNEGVSLIIVNNSAGLNIVEELRKNNRIELREVEKDKAIKYNIRVYSGYYERPKQRDYIIGEIRKKGFNKVANKEIKIDNNMIRILKKVYVFVKNKLKY